jgi:hypothetical protein
LAHLRAFDFGPPCEELLTLFWPAGTGITRKDAQKAFENIAAWEL